ncbi:SGNH/GDSL hydrolase family protein [Hymenobacter sp. BT18]|uniref:SGNH/GDSL hydrolase family protein n=1 Tax=Hymenobacter sp. BT18 TaxID=2835648 RepID=UPI00143E1988|nr:SGNH/GDSL hydrolase family protein [Hymenobacter sp. BT18]QIX60887.1 SGNH/GDSL hydrolase family protein [Hymenobacter sp. BT18]
MANAISVAVLGRAFKTRGRIFGISAEGVYTDLNAPVQPVTPASVGKVNTIRYGDSLASYDGLPLSTYLQGVSASTYSAVRVLSYAGNTTAGTKKWWRNILEQSYDPTVSRNIIYIQFGTNDLPGLTKDQLVANLTDFIGQANKKGYLVVLGIPGLKQYSTNPTNPTYFAFRTHVLDNWQAMGAARMLDLYPTEVGAADADRVQYFAADQIHYSDAGKTAAGMRIGEAVVALANVVRPMPAKPIVTQDAANRTLTITNLPAGYTVADVQVSLNYGYVVEDWTGGTLNITTPYKMLAGQFCVRFKDKNGAAPSEWTSNNANWSGAQQALEVVRYYDPRIVYEGNYWTAVGDLRYRYTSAVGRKATIKFTTKGIRFPHLVGVTEGTYEARIKTASNPDGFVVAQLARPSNNNSAFLILDYYDPTSNGEEKTLEYYITAASPNGYVETIELYE